MISKIIFLRRGDDVDREKMRLALFESAIKLCAKYGMAGITTRRINEEMNIAQYYLYRVFDSIEDLQEQTFSYVTRSIVCIVLKNIAVCDNCEFTEENEQRFFEGLWADIKPRGEEFEYFVRYYYNNIFPNDLAIESFKNALEPLLAKSCPFFKNDKNIVRILVYVIENLVKYSLLIKKGEHPDSNEGDGEVYKFLHLALSSQLH